MCYFNRVMTLQFIINIDELDIDMINKIKKKFKGQNVELQISTMDETDYINSSPAMVKRIKESLVSEDVLTYEEVKKELDL